MNSTRMKTLFCATILLYCISNLAFSYNSDEKQPRLKVKGQPSGRDLLHRQQHLDAMQPDQPDTLSILAIRAEFVADTLDLTTGDGKFVLTPPDEPTIDPPPHDKNYFEAQLQALSNYYRTVSNNKFVLSFEVYPQQTEAAYQLPNNMLYYAPDDEQLTDSRLAELFRDAFHAADQQDAITFSDFDSFVLFHAGVGNDVGFDFDPTPNDVTSAFLSLDDLRESLGNGDPNYQGITVQNGSFFIPDGIILPETESQEGIEIGLLGTSAIMMGFQIGLPSLFDPDNGASGIGRWGLMDQGSGNFRGLLPAEPSAWEKVFMGWEQPIVVQNGENFQVAAPRETITPNKIYKIPINADEYLLIENRQRDVNSDDLAVGLDVSGNRVEFSDANGGEIAAGAVIGVITTVDEYDFGLPGSGILIWHIDEAVIREHLGANRVNADRDRRGVDLEEADGAQDIGQFYGFLDAGSGAENGVPEDAWWASNPVITQFLRPDQPVFFGPNTQPNTRANNGANSHVVISDFSESADIMSFSVSNDLVVSGFPQYVGPGALPPVVAELDQNSPGKEILIARADGQVLAWCTNGNSLVPATKSVSVEAPGKEKRQFFVAEFVNPGSPISVPPAATDLDGDGADEILLATDDGRLLAYALNADSPQKLWESTLGARPASHVSVRQGDKSLWIGLEDGALLMFAPLTGEPLEVYQLPPAVTNIALTDDDYLLGAGTSLYFGRGMQGPVLLQTFAGEIENIAIADLDNDGKFDFIGKDAAGNIGIYSASGQELFSFQPWQQPEKTGLAVGDVDGDGRKDLVFSSATGIYAFNYSGASLLNFPIRFPQNGARTPRFIEPLLLNANADEMQEIFSTARNGDLHAYSRDGLLLDGFPIALTNGDLLAAAAADIDQDGAIELLAISGDVFLNAFRLSEVPANAEHAWTAWGGDAGHTRSNLQTETPRISNGNLLPAEMAYNYPNPTEGNSTTIRYRLNEAAKVSIKIIDLAGDLVDEFAGPAVAHADNEIRWQLDNIQSGVYFARIEAQGERKKEVAVFKIAVVK
ncbi:MAG: T9SS type A sorting domain-containing protein [bacterium]